MEVSGLAIFVVEEGDGGDGKGGLLLLLLLLGIVVAGAAATLALLAVALVAHLASFMFWKLSDFQNSKNSRSLNFSLLFLFLLEL